MNVPKEYRDQAAEDGYTVQGARRPISRRNSSKQFDRTIWTPAEMRTKKHRRYPEPIQVMTGNKNPGSTTNFPTAVRIFCSKGLRAPLCGRLIHTVVIAALDATLLRSIKCLVGWNLEALGILFVSIANPSLLGLLVGWCSDRCGVRKAILLPDLLDSSFA